MFPDVQVSGVGGLGGQEVLLILLVALVLFGGKKIPEMAKGLGEGIRNFKHSIKEEPKAPTPEEKKTV